MGIYFTGTIKVWVFIMHVDFDFSFKLGPKVGLCIVNECILCSRFYGTYIWRSVEANVRVIIIVVIIPVPLFTVLLSWYSIERLNLVHLMNAD